MTKERQCINIGGSHYFYLRDLGPFCKHPRIILVSGSQEGCHKLSIRDCF